MLLIMSQLLLLPTKQPRYCRQPGQRIKTKHKTESSSSHSFPIPRWQKGPLKIMIIDLDLFKHPRRELYIM